MKRPPKLKTAMTPFPYSVDLNATLEHARELMEEHGIHHLPVVDSHAVVGVITEGELNRARDADSAAGGERKLRDLNVSDAYVVDLNSTLDDVLMTMATKHIDSVIVTKAGRLAGVFTSVDACKCFAEYLRKEFPRGEGDDVA